MKLQTYIRLEKLRFRALHGVLPQERQVGGDFTVTLRIGYPWQAAMDSDAVADTLDYAAVYRLVRCEMAVPSQLLEHVAGRILSSLFENFGAIQSATVTVSKENPPVPATCQKASFTLTAQKL